MQLRLHHNIARFDLGRKKMYRFLDDVVDAFRPELWAGGPDGAKELADDGIEPVNFTAADVDGMLEFVARFALYFACLSLHQLQMDVDGVKRVAEFMGHTSCEQGERVQAL